MRKLCCLHSSLQMLACVIAGIMVCACSQKVKHQSIKPIPSNVNMENIVDAKLPADFSVSDFDWNNKKLHLTLFYENIYDGKMIDAVQPDDTLFWAEDTIIVKGDAIDNDFVTINNGIEEGGAYLQRRADGNYRGVLLDDHSIYSKIGDVTLKLADNFVLIDCGDNPEDPYDTIRTAQKQYLDGVKEYKKEFCNLNTIVTIKNGTVTAITRRWIP